MENINNKQPHELKICSITWNLHGESPDEYTISLLLNNYKLENYDIFVIGTEECLRSIFVSIFWWNKSEWEETLHNFLGKDKYSIITSQTLVATHIIAFAKTNLLPYISCIGSSYIKTGAYNLLGNKGAVYLWFKYLEQNLLFINCHLAAYRDGHVNRVMHYYHITNNIYIDDSENVLGKELYGKEALNAFDFVLWMGDYNSRTDSTNKIINEMIRNADYQGILRYDQLTQAIKKGDIDMNGFVEENIMFNPTFKLKPGTYSEYQEDEYERIPSYTDRIFYKVKDESKMFFTNAIYSSNINITISDHKPVILTFKLGMFEEKKEVNKKEDGKKQEEEETENKKDDIEEEN